MIACLKRWRPGADLTIFRKTPCAVGQYSLVVALGQFLHWQEPLRCHAESWYPKIDFPTTPFGQSQSTIANCCKLC
jgi:hypothetical protein